jgi:hypothetical protein
MTDDIKPPMPIKPCEHVKALPRDVESYASRFSHFSRKSIAWAATSFESALNDAMEKDRAIHAENEAAIAHNTAMRARIIAMMQAAGVPDSYRAADPNSRSRFPKHKTFEAGYLGDLRRTFPVADGFADAPLQFEARTKAVAAAKEKAQQEKAEQERQAEAAKAKRRADLVLASIIVRYQLPEDSDWPQVLEDLCKRDKYLDLAVAGRQTRGDWSEGFWRVENALKRFKIESDQDKDIAANLCGCLASDDGDRDGRIFRDTTWSYGKLFALVADKQLVADAQAAMGHVQ